MRGQGDNEPKPFVPREEGSVPFIFVDKAFKILGKGDNKPKPSGGGGGGIWCEGPLERARGTMSSSPPCPSSS